MFSPSEVIRLVVNTLKSVNKINHSQSLLYGNATAELRMDD